MNKTFFYIILFAILLPGVKVFGQACPIDPGFEYVQNCSEFNFIDTSVYTPGDIDSVKWYFGEGDTVLLDTPPFDYSYTYADHGTYDVTLKLFHFSGCDTLVTSQIKIFNPLAKFEYDLGCPGDTTFFTDISEHNADSLIAWEWDFGDMSPQEFEQNPSHVYGIPNMYDVLLIVTNNLGCTDDTTIKITPDRPVAAFESDTVCFGNPTTFFNNSSYSFLSIEDCFWDFGDGGTSTDCSPNPYTYSMPGVDTAWLKVINSLGCADSIFHRVVVDSLPEANFSFLPGCIGQETCFEDLSIAYADSLTSWSWDFGDGGTSDEKDPCHVYFYPNTFTVTLTVTNSNGCISETFEQLVVIDQYAPEASFSASTICFGDTTFFTNLTDTNNVQVDFWEWEFGDPASGPENYSSFYEPYHIFTHQGEFDVKLKVQNIHGCYDSIVSTIVLDSLPEARFTMPDTIAVGVPVTFTDQSLGNGIPILTRIWDFGDGTTPVVNPNPVVHTFAESGTYDVCLMVTNTNGCSDTSYCKTITISALPSADFDYTSDGTLVGNFFDISSPDTTIINWYWEFGDPFDPTPADGDPEPNHQYTQEGFYNVYLQVLDEYGGIHDTTKQVYIGNAVIAEFLHQNVCTGDTSYFRDQSYSPISAELETWTWYFGDGTDTSYTTQTDTIVHVYDTSGVYNVKLVVSALINSVIVSDSILYTVYVHQSPVASFDSTGLGVCYGEEVDFDDLSYTIDGDTIVSWFWDYGNGEFSDLQNNTYIYPDTGEYRVTLFVETITGCVDSITHFSYSSYAPEVTIEYENNCVNSPMQFYPEYDPNKVEVTSWLWNFGDIGSGSEDTSTLENPTHVYSSVRNYIVNLDAFAQGCKGNAEAHFLVYPIPYSAFDVTPDYQNVQGRTKFDNGSIYADHFLWDFGNGNTSTVENPIEVYEQDSTYTITLISYNEYNCADTSRYELLVFFKGLYFPTAFSPNNPNKELSRFEPKGVNLAEYHVQVFDLKGNLMWESETLDENGSPTEGWDGYWNGILQPQGVYVWRAEGVFRDGTFWKGSEFQSENPQTHGTVTLIR